MYTEAKPPFDTLKADIILCSSDAVHFRVYRCLLAFASPFFDAMFDLPQPEDCDEEKDTLGVTIIQLTESARTVDMLLRYCYPITVNHPKLETAADIEAVLEAAIKYDMEKIEDTVRGLLLEPQLLNKEPFRVLLIARRFHYKQEAKAAATRLLQLPPDELNLLANADWKVLQGLTTYRLMCSQAVQAIGNGLTWLQKEQSLNFYGWWTGCCLCQRRADIRYLMHGTYAREWWVEYMDDTLSELQETPCSIAVTKNVAKAIERARDCLSCRQRAQIYIADFCMKFSQEIDQAIAGVSNPR